MAWPKMACFGWLACAFAFGLAYAGCVAPSLAFVALDSVAHSVDIYLATGLVLSFFMPICA